MNTGGVEDLRRRNTGQILTSLRAEGPATRTELARRTGLAKATVGTIIGGLDDLVAETEVVPSGRGRPGRAVALTGSHLVGLGVEINVDYVSFVEMDLSGKIRETGTIAVDSSDTPLQLVQRVVADRVETIRAAGATLVGLSAAVPGLVAADHATVRWAPNLQWSELDLAAVLARAAGGDVPCSVDNDANCAAAAEASRGAARDVNTALYLTGTIGIGAGLLQRRDLAPPLLRGAAGFAGEVGHLPLGAPGATCGCGRTGCWEASIGLRGMLATVGLPERVSPWDTATEVAERATEDADVAAALSSVGTHLGRGLATISGMIDPAAIVLGGYFVTLAPWLVPAAETVLAQQLTFADLHLPQIRLSTLGLQAAALGAAEQSLASVFAGSVPTIS